MKKDKDADRTDKMDVIMIYIAVQIAHKEEKVTRGQNAEFKEPFLIRY